MSRTAKTIFTTAAGLVALAGAFVTLDPQIDMTSALDSMSQSTYASAETMSPIQQSSSRFAEVTGQANIEYDPQPGEYVYLGLDEHGRTIGSYAMITAHDRVMAKDDIHPQFADNDPKDPSGWPSRNEKVSITNPETGQQYNGWFWNRSHLIADSLGGRTTRDNWVTGSRMQNVGFDHNDGMAYTETKVRDYLDDVDNVNCPVYYAAIPKYVGVEAIPATVDVDVKSCDGAIDEHVVVHNTAPGWLINYNNGDIKETVQ